MTAKILDRIGIAVLLILTLGSIGLAVLLTGKTYRQVADERDQMRRQGQQLDQARANLNRYRTALAESKKHFEDMHERIPSRGKIGAFLEALDACLDRNNVDLAGFTPEPVAEEHGYHRIPIRLSIVGGVRDLHSTLFEIETMKRVVRIDSLHVTRGAINDPCTATIAVSLFER